MIYENIEKDTHDEFLKLQSGFKLFTESNSNINQNKKFLKTHVPKEICNKSELLLDTLLNYLMKKAITELEKADLELRNKFFITDFRKLIKDWAIRPENKLNLTPNVVKYSIDPRLKQGSVVGGTIFIFGLFLIITFSTSMVFTTIAGLATILISIIAFKIAYGKATLKSRETIKTDIDNYVENAEIQVQEWLKSIIDFFLKDFNEFCIANNFEVRLEPK